MIADTLGAAPPGGTVPSAFVVPGLRPRRGHRAQRAQHPAATISLVGGVLSVIGIGTSFIPFVGIMLGIPVPAVAIWTSLLSAHREPAAPKALRLTGLVLASAALLTTVIVQGFWVYVALTGGLAAPTR